MESECENNRLAGKVNPLKFIEKYIDKHISAQSSILDIGCGPVVIANQIAKSNPDVKVIGIDMSANRLAQACKSNPFGNNLSIIAGNVYYLPFQDNSFNFIYSRFLFEYLKYPQNALTEMKRVCKRGGIVMVQDIDGQFSNNYPEDSDILQYWQKIFTELKKTGFDPDVGRKLFSFFKMEGFKNINVNLESYHLIAGKIAQADEYYWKKKLLAVNNNFPKFTELKHSDVSDITGRYLDYLQNEDTLSFSNLFTVYGVKN